jgi:glycosyltransferase involved in cell wall biosynthesis
MRIGIIAPLELRVPPIGYGGTELVVSLLTEELVRRGHDVTLFASGDSITRARLVAGCERYLRGSARDSSILTMLNAVSCLERASEYDIIHNHTSLEGMAAAGLVRTPVLTTLHGGILGDWKLLFMHYKGWYNTISHAMKALLPKKERFAGVVYNSINVASYPFNSGKRDDYLLFLSRISSEKGPHLAIEAAKRLGARLIIAGNVHSPDRPYFEERVLPRLDGDQIVFVGEADYYRKRELMARARCLLAPVVWPEPFGLFMAEAMACGTPVIAFNNGAAPEVVSHGETGYIVNNVDEMAEAVGLVDRIDPSACRRHVEQRFNVSRMADEYLSAYIKVLESEGQVLSMALRRRDSGIVAPRRAELSTESLGLPGGRGAGGGVAFGKQRAN